MLKIKTLGVDGNWVLHRAFHTQKYEARDPGAIIMRNFVSMVCKDALLFRANRVLVAFDGARIFRHKLFPLYKANRNGEVDGKSPYDYLDGLKTYLAECGIHCVQHHSYEADDILCSLVSTSIGEVGISTKDKDAYQYVTDRVTLIDSSAKPFVALTTYKDIEKKFGVPPELCLDLQTLVGDKIDNIPQLVSRARSIKGLATWGSLKNWLANDKELRFQLRGQGDALRMNRKLVKLVGNIPGIEAKPVVWNKSNEMPKSYVMFKDYSNPKSKGLF